MDEVVIGPGPVFWGLLYMCVQEIPLSVIPYTPFTLGI